MVELLLILTFLVSVSYLYMFMRRMYPIAFIVINSITLSLVSTTLISLMFYYSISHQGIYILIIALLVMLLIEMEYLNKHPITKEVLVNKLFVMVFDSLLISIVFNAIYLIVARYTNGMNFIIQILFVIFLIGVYSVVQYGYGKLIKRVRLINRIYFFLLIVISVVILTISLNYRSSSAYDYNSALNPESAILTKVLETEEKRSIVLSNVSDIVIVEDFIYYVTSDEDITLYAYNVVDDSNTSLLVGNTTPNYQTNYICINQYRDSIYITSQTGLYYLANGVLTPMYLHNPGADDLELEDFYSALYLYEYSLEDETETLFFETETTRYVVDGDSLSEYPEPYDIDWLLYDVDLGYESLYKLAWKLKLYNFVIYEDYSIINGIQATYNLPSYLEDHILVSGYQLGSYQMPANLIIDLNDRAYLFNQTYLQTCKYKIEGTSTLCLETDSDREHIQIIDNSLYLNTWKYYGASTSIYQYDYEFDLFVLEQSPLTLNSYPVNKLGSSFWLVILLAFMPLYNRKSKLYDF